MRSPSRAGYGHSISTQSLIRIFTSPDRSNAVRVNLKTMFAREDVRAIVCARGGYGANYLLQAWT